MSRLKSGAHCPMGFFLTSVSDFRTRLGKVTIYYGQLGGIFVQICLKRSAGRVLHDYLLLLDTCRAKESCHASTASAGKPVEYKHLWSFIVKLCNSPRTLSSEMSQTGMPGPCYCIFLGLVFFISPQWHFCALLQDEVLATEWGDQLGLSHRERVCLCPWTWQRDLQEVKPPEWMGHKQQVELQSTHISVGIWLPWRPCFIQEVTMQDSGLQY